MSVPIYRVKRQRGLWRVQERRRWMWRYVGPFGVAEWGKWQKSSDALWFANLCERGAKRDAAANQGKEG